MPEPILPPAQFERTDVTARSAAIVFPAILVGLLLSIMLVWWIFPRVTVDRRLPSPIPQYPSPRLQSDPAADSAGWDDQAKGIGHIPIDEAMRRVAASGIPDWPK